MVLVLLAGILSGCDRAGDVDEPPPIAIERYSATHESIAFANLDFTLDSARAAFNGSRDGHLAARSLVSSLLTRARFRNSYADLDEADAVASRYVADAPGSADAWLVQADVDLALHRFVDADQALERALASGAPADTVAARRVALRVATGRAAEVVAEAEARTAAERSYAALTQLASVYDALGDADRSEAAFAEALRVYSDVSPFAMAWVQFERGMLVVDEDPARALALFDEALHYLPGYVSARTDRAAALAATGDVEGAIDALTLLCASVDDPEAAGLLTSLLRKVGESEAAAPWRERARQAFEALLARHPLAFADHAAEFYLRIDEPRRALALAQANLENRETPRSRLLVEQAKSALAARAQRG